MKLKNYVRSAAALALYVNMMGGPAYAQAGQKERADAQQEGQKEPLTSSKMYGLVSDSFFDVKPSMSQLVDCPQSIEYTDEIKSRKRRPTATNEWPPGLVPWQCLADSEPKQKKSMFGLKYHLSVGWPGYNDAYQKAAVGIVGLHTTFAEIGRMNFGTLGIMLVGSPYYEKGIELNYRLIPWVPLFTASYKVGDWKNREVYFGISIMREIDSVFGDDGSLFAGLSFVKKK